MQTTTCDPV